MATTSGATMEDDTHDYTQAFPALPEGNPSGNMAPAFGGNWLTKFSVKTSKCTQVSNTCNKFIDLGKAVYSYLLAY